MAAAHGNKIDHASVIYAKTETAITVAPGTALCVAQTTDEFGEVELPLANGDPVVGFLYESTTASGQDAKVARREQFWVPVGEAITVGNELMASTTGAVLVLAATKYKVGTALTAQATTGAYVLVQAELGSQKET